MLRRGSGALVPTPTQLSPLRLVLRLIVPLVPIVIEMGARWLEHERQRRAFESEAMAHMTRPVTNEEALQILAVPSTIEGALAAPLAPGTRARALADENFLKFFTACQPDPASESAGDTGAKCVRSDYLAGKFSAAYRQLVDPKWDEPA